MPYCCAVSGCKGNYKSGPKVSIFRFPSEENMRQKWIKAMKQENFIPTKSSRVCERHFVPTDFILTNEAYDETGKFIQVRLNVKRLDPAAVPTIFPDSPGFSSSQSSTSKKYALHRAKRKKKEFVNLAVNESLKGKNEYDVKRLLELAKQQAKEIEEVGSFENAQEGPIICSVSSIRSDEEQAKVKEEKTEDSDGSHDSNEKTRQASLENDVSQNNDRYPTTHEEQKSVTSTPQTTLYTASSSESSKHKPTPTSPNSIPLFGDNFPNLVLVDLSRLNFSPSSLHQQQQLLFIKRPDDEKTSSTILKDEKLFLECLTISEENMKVSEADSNTNKADNTTDSAFLVHQPLISKQSEKTSIIEDPSEYRTLSSTHLKHQQLFAKQKETTKQRTALEERKAAAMERKVAAEEKFLALEERKIAVAERKVAAQERLAAAAKQKLTLLKRTLDYDVRFKRWKNF